MSSSDIPSELIEAVTDIARAKRWELGRALGISHTELLEYQERSIVKLRQTAYQVIHAWTWAMKLRYTVC